MQIDSIALRDVPTPEGTPVRIQLADRAVRFAALALDLFFIIVALVVLSFLIVLLTAPTLGSSMAIALLILLTFFLRTPYFITFELRWQGQTPGKRILGLRVVDRHGGVLTGTAIVARNLVREVEVFLPISLVAMLALRGIEEADFLNFYATLTWLGLFALMPLFNRDRMRVGDMLAGTWVVSTRQESLHEDLVDPQARPGRTAATYSFTIEQLDAYGIAELQLLERLLRGADSTTAQLTREDVCKRIRSKIGWPEDNGGGDPKPWSEAKTKAFLWDYYAALRTRLEQRALLGDRRADKHSLVRKANASAPEPAGRRV